MKDFPVEIVACFVGLVLVALFAGILFRRLRFPYTLGLVIVGMGLFKLGDLFPALDFRQRVHLTPNFILYILLPTLIFDAALNLDVRALMRYVVPVFALAAPGVLVSTAVVGLLIAKFTPLGLNAAMLFGALISATDPVAVIGLFNELGAPKRLSMVVDGESLFNDATAIVAFDIVAAIAAGGLLLADPADAWNLAALAKVPGQFLLVFFGGTLVGVLAGWLVMQVIRLSHRDPLTEVGLTTVVAYAAFILANHYLKWSGVMAACGAGVMVNFYSKRILGDQMHVAIRRFWSFAAFMANSIIFLLLGLTESFLIHDLGRLRFVAAAVGVAILAVVLARAIIVGLTVLCYNPFVKRAERITWPEQFIMLWGGLRGALPIALAVSIAPAIVSPAERTLVIQLTLGVILFTILVQGTTMKRFMRRFGMVGTAESSPEAEE